MRLVPKSFLDNRPEILRHRPGFVKNTILKHFFPKPEKGDQNAASGPSLLQVEGSRPNARFRAEQNIRQGQGGGQARDDAPVVEKPAALHPSASGKDVLWPPHLRANIAARLRPHGQRMLLHTIAGGAFGRSLGAAPRFDTLRELPEATWAEVLRSPVTAEAVLKEAREQESDAQGALIAATVARAMPNEALQLQAMDHSASVLSALRQQEPLPEQFGLILSNIAKVFGTRTAEDVTHARALIVLSDHLPVIQGAQLTDVLSHLATHDCWRNSASLKDETLDLLKQHIDRVPASGLPVVLGKFAGSLEHPTFDEPDDVAAHQQRAVHFLREQLERIQPPSGQGLPLLALANARLLLPGTEAAFHDCLAGALPQLSPDHQGRIMSTLAMKFSWWRRDHRASQERVMNLLERHIGHLPPTHRGSCLQHLVDILHPEQGAHVEPDIQERALALTAEYIDHIPPGQRMQTLVELSGRLAEMSPVSEATHEVFMLVTSKLSGDMATLGPLREQGDAVVTAIAHALASLPHQDAQDALAFIGRHLPDMPLAQRMRTLRALASSGLPLEPLREQTQQMLRSHFPSRPEASEAVELCRQLMQPVMWHAVPADMQKDAAAILMHQLPAVAASDKLPVLRDLAYGLGANADTEMQGEILTAMAHNLADPSSTDRAGIVELLSRRLMHMEGDHAERCMRLVTSNWDAIREKDSSYRHMSVDNLATCLSAAHLPQGLKRNILETIVDMLSALPYSEARYFGDPLGDILRRAMDDEHFPSELREPALVLLGDCIRWSEATPRASFTG